MLPPSINPSLLVQPDHITDENARGLRCHARVRDVGYGWLRIAWSESFPDRVLLVSTSAPLSVSFPHGSADIDQMRASLSAGIYACRNPHVALGELL
jgi:hypothetical protein